MLEPSFARERLAIYHRAMEAKNQGRDQLACSLMHEAVGDLFVLPKASPGREMWWWDEYMPAFDQLYGELMQTVNAFPETVKAPDFVVGWTAAKFVDACEQFFGGRRND